MPTPHDALFRHTFGDPSHAGPLLRALLDPAIVAAIDWRTLRRVPEVDADERQQERRGDLLFSVCVLGRTALLLLLPEHKSRPDPWTPLQLLDYQVGHWKQLHRQQPHLPRLPPIVPVLVHCGARRWRATCDLRALIDLDGLPPALVATQPQFAVTPHDFAGRTPAEVRAMALSLFGLATIASLQFVAPHAGDDDTMARRLAEWADVARRIVSDPHGQDAIAALSSYLLSITRMDRGRLRVVIQREIGTKTMKKFVSTLERERIEERTEVLLRLLKKRFGTLPATIGKKVRAARPADLDRWLDRLLDAESLTAVFRSRSATSTTPNARVTARAASRP